MKHFSLRAILAIATLGLLASCNGSSSGGSFVGNLPGPNPPPSFTRFFVGENSPTTKVFIISPPIGSPLTPVASFAGPTTGVDALAFNGTNGVLAASAQVGAVAIFNPPYSGSTTPVVTMTGGSTTLLEPEQMAWDASGNLWVADFGSGKVDEFVPPFTAGGAPVATNAQAATPWGLAINPVAGLMFIGDVGSHCSTGILSCHVYVVPAPYTGVATATFTFGSDEPTAVAVDLLGRLFVGFGRKVGVGGLQGKILVYVPPFATGNSPAFTLTDNAGLMGISALAFDSAQNLYVQQHDGNVDVFNGPILGPIAAPSAALGVPTGSTASVWGGLGFGP